MNESFKKTIFDQLGEFSSNASYSSDSLQKILPRVLDFLLPGYGPISNAILDAWGFDISLLIWILLSLSILISVRKLVLIASAPFMDLCMRDFTFDSGDEIYREFLNWAEQRGIGLRGKSVRVEIDDREKNRYNIPEDFDPLSDDIIPVSPQKVRMMPAHGSHWFWYNYRLFRFEHYRREKRDGEEIIEARVSCLSFSFQPLEALFKGMLDKAHAESVYYTRIYMPASKERRRDGWGYPWELISKRRSRTLRSIILDQTLKIDITHDMKEFLQEDTARWYSGKGIPYRRGYLFVGPPGTGKTSLSFVLAGRFRVPIYVVPLGDPSISDDDLLRLFKALPDRCIVVIEDIDSAGIKNRGAKATGKPTENSDLNKEDQSDGETDNRITLSGLLNVIDGIVSREGRIVIMSTNNPEALDPALKRPGRTDLTINFELLSASQAQELFTLMYQGAAPGIQRSTAKVTDPDRLEDLAQRFGKLIPDKAFSAAEVQGYLILHKHDPNAAVAGFPGWIGKHEGTKKVEEEGKEEPGKKVKTKRRRGRKKGRGDCNKSSTK